MKNMRTLSAVVVFVGLIASSAMAVTQDVTEWNSDTTLVPGLIMPVGGHGQVNGNFTAAEAQNVQIGLRANRRFSPVPLTVDDTTYFVEAGESTPGAALWNYDIHIDTRDSGYSLADFDVYFTFMGPSLQLYGSADLQMDLEFLSGATMGSLDNVELFQMSSNPAWLGPDIDPWEAGFYTIDLALLPNGSCPNAPTLSTSIVVAVQPVPEPVTMVALTLGMTGLGGYIRRRVKA